MSLSDADVDAQSAKEESTTENAETGGDNGGGVDESSSGNAHNDQLIEELVEDGEENPLLSLMKSTTQTQAATSATSSYVNGRGLWRSWQRSFRRPLDALLDLMDNAIDANHGQGRIRITTSSPDRNDSTGDEDGLLLLNSYNSSAYKEMHKVLEVFSSQKDQEAIGENGVGIKQASANLSNFAVVVTRKDTRFQVGILCVSLQRPEGVHIPSYTFESNDWEQELDDLIESDSVFCTCMEYFGGKPVPLDSDADEEEKYNNEKRRENISQSDFALQQAGRDRLLELMSHISSASDWKEYECVFGLLLDQLRFRQSVQSVLDEICETLPKTYLHLQAHQFDIKVQKKVLKFQYWERRLAELTCFPVKVSRTVSVATADKDSIADPQVNANSLRIFIGFDPVRSRDDNQQSCATLYFYSRDCGRLVKHSPDARNELGLNSGGTQFCQGLTIILDDFESSFPLTPTKQDIAWSDGEQGDIHRANVYSWLRTVTYTYYTHHLSHFVTKGALNDEVKSHAIVAESLFDSTDFVTPMSEYLFFNAFAGLQWARHSATGRIMPKNKNNINVVYGAGTLIPFTKVEKKPKETKQKKTACKTASSSARKRSIDDSVSPHFSMQAEEVPSSFDASNATGKGRRRYSSKRSRTADDSSFAMVTQDTLNDVGSNIHNQKYDDAELSSCEDVSTGASYTHRTGIRRKSRAGFRESHLVPIPSISSTQASTRRGRASAESSRRMSEDGYMRSGAESKNSVALEENDDLRAEVLSLRRKLREKDEQIVTLKVERDALEKKVRRTSTVGRESPSDEDAVFSKVEYLEQQLEAKEMLVDEIERNTDQTIREKDEEIQGLKRKHAEEVQKLEKSNAQAMDRLRRRNQQLEVINQGMKAELEVKNEQLMALEEELES